MTAKTTQPRAEVYDLIAEATEGGVENPVDKIITAKNSEFRQQLLSSDNRDAIERVKGMNERAEFTKTARDLIKEPLDWQAIKDTVLPEPKTAAETLDYALTGTRDPERRAKIKSLISEVESKPVPENLRPTASNDRQIKTQSARNKRTERARPDKGKDFGIGDD